jgi:hypothetical protein
VTSNKFENQNKKSQTNLKDKKPNSKVSSFGHGVFDFDFDFV